MSITVTFRCGHVASVNPDAGKAIVCPTCGQAGVSRVSAPPPRFVGVASGPYVTRRALEPSAASILTQDQTPLILKPLPKDDAHG